MTGSKIQQEFLFSSRRIEPICLYDFCTAKYKYVPLNSFFMNLKTKSAFFVLLASLLLISACSTSRSSNSPAAFDGKVKFLDTPDGKNAHLISGDQLDPVTVSALAGFNLQKNLMPDGSVQIILTAIKPGYFNQSYNLKPGEKLYFIEKFMADDSGDSDFNLKDDTAVVVDAQGYVLQ
jgi:hypothetical protein